jgi:hypothetical protein
LARSAAAKSCMCTCLEKQCKPNGSFAAMWM